MARFEKGQTGNPEGRPKGIPNRVTQAVRDQVAAGASPIEFLQRIMAGEGLECPGREGEEPSLVFPTMDQRMRAATTLAHKLAPDAKDQPVKFSIGKIENLAGALAAMAKVTEAMSEGELTPVEATAVMAVIAHYAKAYEASELERRIADLEAAGR
jgi:hypothetical protein